jgi:hypothetical protein
MTRTRYELRHTPDEQWGLYKKGADRATKKFETKQEGLDYSRPFVRDQGHSQLVIKKADGTIQTEHTYGEDPYPPPG